MIQRLRKWRRALSQLQRKFAVLRSHHLLDDRVTADELATYLFANAGVGRHRGFLRSLPAGIWVDADGSAIPWYTYPAIEQLSKWDFTGCDVFEYGCGNSTRWWAGRARSVVSVEGSQDWYEKVLASGLQGNVTPVLARTDVADRAEALKRYVARIDEFDRVDVLVIDGEAENETRLACARSALKHLGEGVLIIVDNADCLPASCRLLRETGLSPLNSHASKTSMFLAPGFRVRPLAAEHPGPVIAGLEQRSG